MHLGSEVRGWLLVTDADQSLPNTRLKLAAPVPNEPGCHLECRGDRLPFVITPAWRRSLSAIR